MKIREKDESEIQLSTICLQLKLESADGKKYETDCANAEGIFRIIRSGEAIETLMYFPP